MDVHAAFLNSCFRDLGLHVDIGQVIEQDSFDQGARLVFGQETGIVGAVRETRWEYDLHEDGKGPLELVWLADVTW